MEISGLEKVTINLGVVDLGYIDLLVNNGYYSNRTDFIKNAIRKAIAEQQDSIDELINAKKKETSLIVGITVLTEKEIDKKIVSHETVDLTVVGLLVIPAGINDEKIFKVCQSIKVFGAVKCSDNIKKYYQL